MFSFKANKDNDITFVLPFIFVERMDLIGAIMMLNILQFKSRAQFNFIFSR